ncbi:MAG: Ribonuclease III, partial [uncultured Nocardioidaceae bacterium]
ERSARHGELRRPQAGARGPGPRRRPARARPDAPVVRLRERRAADQRAARVPGRLRARRRRHRDAVPQPPRALRGTPGEAPRCGRQRPGPGRRRPHDRAGRAREARPRRRDHRRSQEGVDPVRHRRGGHRCGLPQRWLRGRRRGRPPAVRPPDGAGRRPRRRSGLEDQPPGAVRRAHAGRARVRHRGRRARPRQDLHRPGAGERDHVRARRGPLQEGSRAAGGRDGLPGAGRHLRRRLPRARRDRL